MKKLFTLFAIVTMFFVTGCQYDDSELTNRVDNLENRVETLETLCAQFNTNISSLQTIVSALQSKDFITSIEPILKDGKTIGWKINFSKNDPITIYNGEDGADGHTPAIGVKKASDGIYYWTIDGEWMFDTDGNKIQAQATDGEDGVTPKFQINDKGYWEVSYDNGETWEELGKATGDDGTSGSPLFSAVDEDNEYVYFTLTDGTVITLPKKTSLSIAFDEEDLEAVALNKENLIGYTVTSVTKSVDIAVATSNDLKARVLANDDTNLTGYIKVLTGSSLDEYSHVNVTVSNGEKMIVKTLNFKAQQGGGTEITIINGAVKSVPAEGGNVTLDFLSDVECEAIIPDAAKSWISVVSSRAVQRSITLNVKANTGAGRSAKITVQSLDGKYSVEYSITQSGNSGNQPSGSQPAPNEIWYTSTNGEKVILSNIHDFEANITSHEYSNGKGVISFDNNIYKIGEGAFRDSREIASIIIPEGVTTIRSNAFNQCNNLTSISFPNSLVNIEYYAFKNCSSIKEIKIPDTTTQIGTGAFKGCSGLNYITIPGSVSVIGQEAFHSCSYITSATIMSGVTEIGPQAFHGCQSMSKISIPETVTKIGHNAFNRTGLVNVQLPSELNSIEDRTFYQCYDLKNINIGNKITKIGEEAFALCYKLTEIKLPDTITEIKRRAFADCPELSSINLPDGVKVINFETFLNCSKLTNIILPNSLTTIKSAAFSGCSEITAIEIPSMTNTIETSAFKGCTKISSFTGNFATKDKRCLVVERSIVAFAPAGAKEYIISNVVSSISENAFYGCTELTSVTLHDQITAIGDYAFTECSNLKEIYCQPTTPPSAGEKIFDGISKEAIIHVPAKCGEAYMAAWSSYASMIQEEQSDDEPEVTEENNKIFYTTNDGKPIEFGADGSFGANEISNNYTEGKGVIEFDGEVTTIFRSAFYGCTTLTSITLPNSLQTIEDRSFENCSSLATIAIPESVTTIGQAVFTGCTSLSSFTGKFASTDGACLVIDEKLIAYATDYNTIYTIPENVTIIGMNSFASNSVISKITIPSNIKEIETNAFSNCSSLMNITCTSTTPATDKQMMFGNLPNGAPKEAEKTYKEQWSEYAYAITAIPE